MRYSLFIICSILLSGLPRQATCQAVGGDLLSGFKQKQSGTDIQFYSGNPFVNNALIVRAGGAEKEASWTTDVIPQQYKQLTVSFVWMAGLATGKNRQVSNYELFINGSKALTFSAKPNQGEAAWKVNGEDGTTLTFQPYAQDENKDSYGYFYLQVPVNKYGADKPLLLQVKSVDTKRYDDWYMTFQHDVKESFAVQERPLLRKQNNRLQQLVQVQYNRLQPTSVDAQLAMGATRQPHQLQPGYNAIELWVPAIKSAQRLTVSLQIAGQKTLTAPVVLQPVVQRDLYLVNHSHNDIGYSDYQPVVAQKHNEFIRQAMQLIEKTKSYPKEARFIWNIEAMWAVENFMNEATEAEIEKLIQYVKGGHIGMPAGYGNLLTGVCRPEELIHLTDYAQRLKNKYGFRSATMMISDVPGMSWNIVSALRQRGVKYISSGPNFIPQPGFPDSGARVGATHRTWGDKPFYWVSASGLDTVLYWQAGTGYSWFQDWNTGKLRFANKPVKQLLDYVSNLQSSNYPYEMVQLRYSIINDNSPPDEGLPDFIAEWNKKYVSPRLLMANVDSMMHQFETRYSKKLPVASGDFTPYWEDGVMSSAKEETIAKQGTDRLFQAQVAQTMYAPESFDAEKYEAAWRNAILWHEHTWGAWNSISQPDEPNVKLQWEYKRNFALRADSFSKALMPFANEAGSNTASFAVVNTSSWRRTDVVQLSKEQSAAGDVVRDEAGIIYPSQRLKNGNLLFLAKDVPALGSKKFSCSVGASAYQSDLKILDNGTIENGAVKLLLDATTGSVKSLLNKATGHEMVNTDSLKGLNQYLYMPGVDPAVTQTAAGVSINIKEAGPLLASFEVSFTAPGARKVVQEVSLVNELNKIGFYNLVDKEKNRGKESVHFAFPVRLPQAQMRVDVGTGVLLPGVNQLAGANNDYISMQRWVDVANKEQGLTFITNEVPLLLKGALINELPAASSQSFGGTIIERGWKKAPDTSNTFFSYAMNNYWYTNYRADQEGPVGFNYALYLHRGYDGARANRQARENAQPLLVVSSVPSSKLPFVLDDEAILVNAIKPADDKKGIIIRLYNAGSSPKKLGLKWLGSTSHRIYESNANEEKLRLFSLQAAWQPYALKTLYIETQ